MATPRQKHIERRLAAILAGGVRRREFIALLGGAAAWSLRVAGAQSSKVDRIALAVTTSPASEMAGPEPANPAVRAFVHGLRTLGYVEGQNLILERQSAEGHPERYRDIFAELVRLNVDVIVTVGTAMTQEAKAVTRTVPIVMATTDADPVETGLVSSLARPGGNITGLSSSLSPEIEGKRFQLLKEMLPGASRVAYLGRVQDWEGPFGKSARDTAQALGVTMILAAHTPTDYKDAFALISADRFDALFVSAGPHQFVNRDTIAEFARKARLPDTHAFREAVQVGALMSYGNDVTDLFRRSALYVDKILKGAKPAELPIEQPVKFELVINLKTAKVLGLTVPPSLLAHADEVIE